jgi:hypothetical protein
MKEDLLTQIELELLHKQEEEIINYVLKSNKNAREFKNVTTLVTELTNDEYYIETGINRYYELFKMELL